MQQELIKNNLKFVHSVFKKSRDIDGYKQNINDAIRDKNIHRANDNEFHLWQPFSRVLYVCTEPWSNTI